MSRPFLVALAIVPVGVFGITPAAAQVVVATDAFSVSATVAGECTVAVNDLDFGQISPSISANIDAQTDATVTCTFPTEVVINLDAGTGGVGLNPDGTSGGRALIPESGSGAINYELYADASRTTALDPFAGLVVPVLVAGEPTAVGIYGRIYSGQTVAAQGTYSSVVTATVFLF